VAGRHAELQLIACIPVFVRRIVSNAVTVYSSVLHVLTSTLAYSSVYNATHFSVHGRSNEAVDYLPRALARMSMVEFILRGYLVSLQCCICNTYQVGHTESSYGRAKKCLILYTLIADLLKSKK
jgi:hypothetical protein